MATAVATEAVDAALASTEALWEIADAASDSALEAAIAAVLAAQLMDSLDSRRLAEALAEWRATEIEEARATVQQSAAEATASAEEVDRRAGARWSYESSAAVLAGLAANWAVLALEAADAARDARDADNMSAEIEAQSAAAWQVVWARGIALAAAETVAGGGWVSVMLALTISEKELLGEARTAVEAATAASAAALTVVAGPNAQAALEAAAAAHAAMVTANRAYNGALRLASAAWFTS